MNVLISGASIAGLTLAYWLKYFGFTPTLVERAPSLRKGGYKIDVRGQALEILRWMDLYQKVSDAKTDMQGASIVDMNGQTIVEMSGDQYGLRTGDDLEIVRGALCQILMDQVKDLEFIFGDSIKSVKEMTEAIEVTFEKHSPRKFDLVIGADGLHSNVRQLVFGKEPQFTRDLGLYLCVFSVPNILKLDRWEMEYIELGRTASLWSSKGDEDAKACFAFTALPTYVDLNDTEKQQELVRSIYRDMGWVIPQLLMAMPKAKDFYFDGAIQIHMNHWTKGRVALVGDAGYCPSPMSGQGSSVALIGAYILAGELAKAKGKPRYYEQAFTQYEQKMRSFVECNQALGINGAQLMKSNTKRGLANWLRNKIMQFAPGRLIQYFISRSNQRIHKAANAIKLENYKKI